MFKFKDSLKNGTNGEDIFATKYKKKLERLDGRKADFKDIDTNELIELKTDFYPLSTGNFFIERYSDKDKKTAGGPWQSDSNGVNRYIYFYVKENVCFDFEVKALVKAMEKIIPSLTPTYIRNIRWVTQGYKVPRKMLENIYSEIQL